MRFFDLTNHDSIEQIDCDLDAGLIGYQEYLQRINNLNKGE